MRRMILGAVSFVLLMSAAWADDFAKDAAGNWPQWRGPEATGAAPASAAPTKWSATENLKWKVEVPGEGRSTPIVWGEKVFLLAAIPTDKTVEGADQGAAAPGQRPHPQVGRTNRVHQFVVLCYDAKSGKELWRKVAREELPHEGHHQKGSYASPSPVTDGERVYAWFGSRGLYCYDLDGKELWNADLGKLKVRLQFGEGSSPVLYKDALIINCDHEGGSFITAIDKKTGKTLWKFPREEGTAWSTPILVPHQGKTQVVVSATRRVRGYDADTGKQIWECGGQTLNAIPTCVAGDGLVFATSGFQGKALKAIKLGHEGDLTQSAEAVAWELKKGTPYVPSPVLWGEELYLLEDGGIIGCYEAATGKPVYEPTRLPGGLKFTASPVGADGKLYLASEQGAVVVVKRGAPPEVLATNKIADETFYASPAVAGGRLYLRSDKTLYCIAQN